MALIRDLIRSIKEGFRTCISPEKEFSSLNKLTLDSVVSDYIRLLIAAALAAGLFNLLFSTIKSIGYRLFLNMDIDYWRMLNYYVGRSISEVFAYLFVGTFGIFFLSLIIRSVYHRLNYVPLLKVMFRSLAPFLLFGWLMTNFLPFLVWSLFLLIVGIRSYQTERMAKNSINTRD
jgi:hypothetical protein